MGALKFIKTSMMTSIHDEGRKGLAYYAIPASGPQDKETAQLANLITGMPENNPVFEFNLIPPKLKFLNAVSIALTGCDMDWKINGQKVKRNRLLHLKDGDILGGKASNKGLCAYLAIRGQLKVKKHYGSASMYAPAGYGHRDGAYFQAGDILEWTELENFAQEIHITQPNNSSPISINPGPEFHLLNEEQIGILNNCDFKKSSETNRMGARLSGLPVIVKERLNESVPVLPGFLQLLPSGQLIITLQDGQTTGGYPRIAFLKDEALNAFSRLGIGQAFRFIVQERRNNMQD